MNPADARPPAESPASLAADPRSARLRLLAGILLAALAAAELLSLTGIAPPPHAGWRGPPPFLAAALAGAFLFQLARRPTRGELIATLLLGAILAVASLAAGGGGTLALPARLLAKAGFGIGLASLLVVGRRAFQGGAPAARAEAVEVLLAASLLPGFVMLSFFVLDLTAAFHPLTRDGVLYAVDGTAGFQPSFLAGRLFAAAPALRAVSSAVYIAIPVAFALLYADRSRRHGAATDVLMVFLGANLIGMLLYHLLPVAGPVYTFKSFFPGSPPPVEQVPRVPLPVFPVARNCVPSLHTTWGLLVFWNARGAPRWVRALAALFLGFTLLATLGLGYHYLVDLVIAVPFAAMAQAIWTRAPGRERRAAIAIDACLVALWVGLLRFAPAILWGAPWLTWTLAAATVGVPLALQRRLAALPLSVPAPVRSERAGLVPGRRLARAIAVVLVLSGLAGALLHMEASRLLSRLLGSGEAVATRALATYLAALALGAWLGGRLASSRRDPLRLFALCQGAVALWAAALPWLLGAAGESYVAIARRGDPARPALVLLEVAVAALALVPAALPAGMMLPLLARRLAPEEQSLGPAAGLLVGAAALGWALGSLAGGDLLLPALGVPSMGWLALALGVAAAALGWRLAASAVHGAAGAASAVDPAPHVAAAGGPAVAVPAGHPEPAKPANPAPPRRATAAARVALVAGGAIALAFASLASFLLLAVAGGTAQARAAVGCAFPLGLGGGALAAAALLRRQAAPLAVCAWSSWAFAALVVAGARAWDAIPGYFASYAGYPIVQTAGAREVVRLTVCLLALAPAAASLGALLTAAIAGSGTGSGAGVIAEAGDGSGRSARRTPGAAVGRAAALWAGAGAAGALAGAFLLLPGLGALHGLYLLAILAALLAIATASSLTVLPRRAMLFAGAGLLALVALAPRALDPARLARGGAAHFAPGPTGTAVDHAESLDGGLVTVVRQSRNDAAVQTLVTDGRPQGDDAAGPAISASEAFALFPLLHTANRDRALVIGFGTGATARVLVDAGFERTDVVDPAAEAVRIAASRFESVHHRVLDRPGVRTHVTDGRHFLLLDEGHYDLIGVEAGSTGSTSTSAGLESAEFLDLVKDHLADGGVLQERLPLHRLDPASVLALIATVHSRLPWITLYRSGSQGVLVACDRDCSPSLATLATLDAAPGLAPLRRSRAASAALLVRSRLLPPSGIERLLAEAVPPGTSANDLISTDDNLLLPYRPSGAGGGAGGAGLLRENLALLHGFAPSRKSEDRDLWSAEPRD